MKETLTLLERCQREARETTATYFHPQVKWEVIGEDVWEKLDIIIANTLKQAAEALEGMKKNIEVYNGHDCYEQACSYCEAMLIDETLTDAQKILES